MIHVVTLGFSPSRIFEATCKQYYGLRQGGYEFRHVMLNQHYPVNRVQNGREMYAIAEKYDIEVIDEGRNLGLSGGFNRVLEYLDLDDNDIVMPFDPDQHPISPGFDMALITALNSAPDVGWATLMFQAAQDAFDKGHPHAERQIAHLRCLELKQPLMNSMCAWRGKFLNETKGLHEISQWYGGLEVVMWPHLAKNNWKWVFLRDWWEDHTFHNKADAIYREYKWALAHEGTFKGDFESYLRLMQPDLLWSHGGASVAR